MPTSTASTPVNRRNEISKTVRFAVFKRHGFRCRYCGASASTDGVVLVLDHIVPVVEGGTDEATNLLTACRDCNAGKGCVGLPEAVRPVARPVLTTSEWADRRNWVVMAVRELELEPWPSDELFKRALALLTEAEWMAVLDQLTAAATALREPLRAEFERFLREQVARVQDPRVDPAVG